MTPDLSFYWEGAREECEDSKWDEKKKRGSIFWLKTFFCFLTQNRRNSFCILARAFFGSTHRVALSFFTFYCFFLILLRMGNNKA